MQLAHEGGQRHVDDGRVEVDRERRQQQRTQDQGLSAHGCSSATVNIEDEVLNHQDKKIKSLDNNHNQTLEFDSMRSYDEYCAIAKSLDVVGDRWTLLIVRELSLRGASRYTDLRNGLPGIASNLLADRLRELEHAGVVAREEAPPPIATALCRLTPRDRKSTRLNSR